MLRSLVRIPVFGFFGSEFLDLIFDKDFFGNIYLGENARRAHGFCARAACDFEERLSTSVFLNSQLVASPARLTPSPLSLSSLDEPVLHRHDGLCKQFQDNLGG